MDALQMVILILGAILFTVSFFIPDKKVNTKEIREKEERIFRELVEKEIPDIRMKIDEVTEDSIERAKENTQRQMERLTNEKMMAISEYSDTVMSEIHKNHEEAVFLYDMLNNKHAQVKNTTAELNQAMKQSKQAQSTVKSSGKAKAGKKAESELKPMKEKVSSASIDSGVQEEVSVEKNVTGETIDKAQDFEPMVSSMDLEVISLPNMQETKPAESDNADNKDNTVANNVEIMFATQGQEENSNDRILEMHKAGKSNMAIARELGLGIGEVKLVIDLFKGGM